MDNHIHAAAVCLIVDIVLVAKGGIGVIGKRRRKTDIRMFALDI